MARFIVWQRITRTRNCATLDDMKQIFGSLLFASALFAQLPAPNAAGVSMGHLHFNTQDLEAHRKLWVDALGAKLVKVGPLDAYKLPDLIVLVNKKDVSDGTEGSVIGHIGLKVRDMKAVLDKCKSLGIKIASVNATTTQAFILVAEDVRIELSADPAMTAPVANHHIHWYTAALDETKAWYVKALGAKPGRRGNFEAADIPGANLTFSAAAAPTLPTKGRALDHIGFEVVNLEAFCKKLEASGVKLEMPFTKRPDLGLSLAFFVDPWGTRVELTEGLNRL
jgi:catechol 2,3-dioxygenase-like lactoylglutathione lyase family enzyme